MLKQNNFDKVIEIILKIYLNLNIFLISYTSLKVYLK